MIQPINELIDDLVAGRLSPTEASEVQSAIDTDSNLQREFEFQKDIQQSIVNARKAALKARLKNIDVNKIPQSRWEAMKPAIAFLTGFTGLILASIIAMPYIDDSALDATNAVTTVELQSENLSQYPIGPKNSKENESIPEVPAEVKQQAEVDVAPEREVNQPDASEKTTDITTKTTVNSKSVSPDINDPSEPKLKSGSLSKSDNSNSEGGMEIAGNANAKPLDIVTIEDAKNDLHYKNYEGKLYLYGDFKGKIYELIEINGKARKFFLYFDGKFYLIKSNIREMQVLQIISDSLVISDLENRRKVK